MGGVGSDTCVPRPRTKFRLRSCPTKQRDPGLDLGMAGDDDVSCVWGILVFPGTTSSSLSVIFASVGHFGSSLGQAAHLLVETHPCHSLMRAVLTKLSGVPRPSRDYRGDAGRGKFCYMECRSSAHLSFHSLLWRPGRLRLARSTTLRRGRSRLRGVQVSAWGLILAP